MDILQKSEHNPFNLGTAKTAKIRARGPGRDHGPELQAEHCQRRPAPPGGVTARGEGVEERTDVQLGEPGADRGAGPVRRHGRLGGPPAVPEDERDAIGGVRRLQN